MIIGTCITSLSIFVTSVSLLTRETTVKFNTYKDKGKNSRQKGKVSKAVSFYREALKYAISTEQKNEVWRYIIYAHTDRVIAAAEEMRDDTQDNWMFENWDWGPTKIPTDYVRPTRSETMK